MGRLRSAGTVLSRSALGMAILVGIALSLLDASKEAQAAARFARTSGSWSTITWGTSCAAGAVAVPVLADDVTICSGVTVTLDSSPSINTLTLAAAAAANGVTFNGFTLAVTGAVTMNAVTISGITSTLNVDTGTLTAASIAITGSATATRNTLLTISTGSITTTGSITFGGTAAQARFTSAGASTVNVGGNFGSGGTLTAGAGNGTFNFNGAVAQTIGAYATYNDIQINNTAGDVSFAGNATLAGALTVNTGALTIGAFTVAVGGTTTVTSTLNITSATGTKTFTGNVTIDGTWNNSGNEAVGFGGNLSNNGTFTSGTGTQTFTAATAQLVGTSAITFNGTLSVSNNLSIPSGTVNLANTAGVTGTTSVDGTLNISSTTGTKTFTGNVSISSTGTWNNSANEAVSFGGNLANDGTFTSGTAVQTFSAATAQLTGAAAIAFAGTLTVTNSLTVNKGAGAVTATGTMTVGATLTVQMGTLNLANATTVTGATSISGTLTHTTTTGARTFIGAVTINNGGTWDNVINRAIAMRNDLTNDGTFTAGTGTYTFQTTANAVWAGTNGLSFGGAVTVSAARINNTTTTVTGTLSVTAGGLTNNTTLNANGTLAISAAVTVTNNGTVTAVGAITGANAATSIWTNAANSTLNVAGAMLATGTLNASAAGNTVNYNGAAQTVKLPAGAPATYYDLTLSGSGIKTMPATVMTISDDFTLSGTATTTAAQALTVGDDFTIGTGTSFTAATFTHNVAGDFTKDGTFTANTSTFNFNGSAAQTLSGTAAGTTTFNNFTLNNASGLTLTGATHHATVNGILTLSNGRLGTGASNLLTVGSAGSVSRAGCAATTTNCFVVGNLVKNVPVGAPTVSWEVGTETASPAYAPVSITFAGAVAGNFQVTTPTAADDHADTTANLSGIDAAASVNRYWTLAPLTATYTNYSPTFTYGNIAGDVDGGATPASFVIAQKSSGVWNYPAISGTPTATTAIATGIASITSDVFAIGNVALPSTSPYSEWRMDETAWNGTANEAADNGSGGFSGTGSGLAATKPTTASVSPPTTGTCRYGVFNRTNKDYVALSSSYPNLNAAVGGYTITAWIRSTDVTQTGQRIVIDDEGGVNGNWGFSLGDGGSGMLRFFYRQATVLTLDTPAGSPLVNNTWYFVAASIDLKASPNTSRVSMYVYTTGGTLFTSISGSFTATSFGTDTTPPSIGGETNIATLENTNSFGFAGNIDEVRVYRTAYTREHINLIRQLSRNCFDHIRITHDGEGLTCAPEQVTVQACADSICSSLFPNSVTTTLDPTGWVGGDTITFTGSTTAQLRQTTTGTVTLSAGSTSPVPTGGSRCFIGASETCSMTFVDSGFIFDVPNLTACKTSADVTITAVKTTDSGETCAPAFSGSKSVGFWSTYSSPITGTQAVSVNGTAIGTSSPGTAIALTFDASAQATFTVNYPDAGQMQLSARHDGAGSDAGLVLLGNDQFVASPVGLAVYAASSCVAGDATCPVFGTAGTAFNHTVKAACWTADGDTDLSDNPATPNFQMAGIPLTHTLVAPSGGQTGSIGTSSFDFVAADNGVHTISQTVSEVGVFSFTATPTVAGYFGLTVPAGTSPNIGRFRPDHYEVVSAPVLTNRGALSCTTPSPFTYLGEALRLTFQLEAQNSADIRTQNNLFSGTAANNFAKLTVADATVYGALTDTAALNTQPDSSSRLTVSVSGTNAWQTGANAGRTNLLQLDVTVARRNDNQLDGAYSGAQIGIAPLDSDGVRLSTATLNRDWTPVDGTNDHLQAGTTDLRFGRLVIANAFGSELVDLSVPMRVQYYLSGTDEFVVNTDDDCTALTLSLSNYQGNLNALPVETCVQDSGSPGLSGVGCAAAAPVSRQFLEPAVDGAFNLFLQAPGFGNDGSVDISAVADAWLLYDWDGDGVYDNSPSGRATFGLFKGSRRQIYRRERY